MVSENISSLVYKNSDSSEENYEKWTRIYN
jgi:hypothetical protein